MIIITLVSAAFSSLIVAFLKTVKVAVTVHVAATAITFLTVVALVIEGPRHDWLMVTDLVSLWFALLTSFISLTSSIYSVGYITREFEAKRIGVHEMRLYHSMHHLFVLALMVAFFADNLGLMWVAIEAATLSTTILIGVYRTPSAIEAAWKYFILCGVAIGLALFGTILLYLTAQQVLGPGMASMAWTTLHSNADKLNPLLLKLSFVFLLIGYGTKIGLVPLHGWLADSHAEGPTPISAVLSGLLLNAGLYALLRVRWILLANHTAAIDIGHIMMVAGVITALFSAFILYQQSDIKRLFSYSSIEHMGIAVFAFGLGGPAATFAGLLHITMHSLIKSAIFFTVGHAAQVFRTKSITKITGLTISHPVIGWGLVGAVVAICGLPPFGLFASEFLIITAGMQHHPFITLGTITALLVAFSALILRLQELAFGTHPLSYWPIGGEIYTSLPLYTHLTIALIAGVMMPSFMTEWLYRIVDLIQ